VGIGYVSDLDLQCLLIVWDGDVSPVEWRAHRERMVADPSFPPGPKALCDLSSAGGAARISEEVLEEIADGWRALSARLAPYKMAVIPNGAWDKARQLERLLDGTGLSMITFVELASACAWLDIPEDRVRTQLGRIRKEL